MILSDNPLTSTISFALTMMVDMSTPITCFAPALAANLKDSQRLRRNDGETGGRDLHAENTGTASDIENDLVLEQMLVLDNGVHVRSSSDLVLQHFFVDTWIACQSYCARRDLSIRSIP